MVGKPNYLNGFPGNRTLTLKPPDHHGNCDEHGGIGADEYADDHRECEVIDGATAEDEERQAGNQRGDRGEQRTAQRRIDGFVAERLQVGFLILAQILADTVEDDDRVVDGVTDDGQQRGDDHQADLAAAEEETEEAVEAEGDECVVREGDDTAEGERELETE